MTLRRCTTKTTLARTDSMVDEGAKVPAAERNPVKRNDEADVDENMANDDTSKDCEPEPLAVQGTKDEGKTCGMCRRKTTDYSCNRGGWVRCKPCASLKARVLRVCKADEILGQQWKELSEEARQELSLIHISEPTRP